MNIFLPNNKSFFLEAFSRAGKEASSEMSFAEIDFLRKAISHYNFSLKNIHERFLFYKNW